jgi:predicted transcriptional regulator
MADKEILLADGRFSQLPILAARRKIGAIATNSFSKDISHE